MKTPSREELFEELHEWALAQARVGGYENSTNFLQTMKFIITEKRKEGQSTEAFEQELYQYFQKRKESFLYNETTLYPEALELLICLENKER